MRRAMTALVSILSIAAVPVAAREIAFDRGWKEQRFSLFSGNQYAPKGTSLAVRSDGTVSLLWTALPSSLWRTRQASWTWDVEKSVPPTDLTRKGGDDRNLSLYFVFLPEQVAQDVQGSGVRTLLDDPNVRVLMYIWGGAHPREEILPSPYLGPRGRSIIKRMSGTGSAAERVDLARDHRRAFGEAPGSLVGVAISSDSDDTGSQVRARIAQLRLE
ncbi:Protein of unknown function [Rhodovulum sp. ES.010]|nr:Protein of unknown function [Rhodovulum sp. ES.010]